MGRPTLKTLRADHEVAVGLRCKKANTKTPRSLVRLDPVLPRDSSGRSILFPSRRSRRDYQPRSPSPRGLTETSTSGGTYVATHPSPAHEDVYRVCKPCFVFTHANPRASGNVDNSGADRRTDTARRASGDSTVSSLICWTLFP